MFRDRLIATLRAARPVLEIEGVMIAGSEVPNLLEPGLSASLVVSEDVDVAVPLPVHAAVKARLGALGAHFTPAPEEPSVWAPREPELLELNFIGLDPERDEPTSIAVLEDSELPLLVFGALSLLRPGRVVREAGVHAVLPRLAGLAVEKLLTERSSIKGERDLLVCLALLTLAEPGDHDEIAAIYRELARDLRVQVRRNLAVLSLARPIAGMPDPEPRRELVAALLARLEAIV